MRKSILHSLVTVLALGLATDALAKEGKPASGDAAVVAAVDAAMNPGPRQKWLDVLIGEFDVKILTWLDPAKPPYESTAVAVSKWVLGNRYV
jgi:hypothetical protein